MKKITKKLIAVVLTALMLLPVMGMQSFAAGLLEAPVPVSVEFVGDKALSMAELENIFEVVKEFYEEHLDWYEEDFDFNECEIDICYSNIDYEMKVTFEDGTEKVVDVDDCEIISGLYVVECYTAISYAEFLETKENNSDTIDIEVSFDVYSRLDEDNVTTYTFQSEKEVIDCYVKSIIPVSGFPLTICETCDYFDINDAKVLVTYGDGSIKTLDVVAEYNEEWQDFEYTVDGEELIIYFDVDNKGKIEYLDAVCDWNVIVHSVEPFKSIEITECDFDAKKGVLNSISYTIEWKTGKTESYTKTFEKNVKIGQYEVINMLDGFYVYVHVSLFDFSEDDVVTTDNYAIELSAGWEEEVTSVYTVANPNKDVTNFFLAIIQWFEKIRDFFYGLLIGFGF